MTVCASWALTKLSRGYYQLIHNLHAYQGPPLAAATLVHRLLNPLGFVAFKMGRRGFS
jgi:hypothetical protein